MTSSRYSILGALALILFMGLVLSGCSDDDDKGTGPQGSWVYKPLGDGIIGIVNAITSFDGKLYVGGNIAAAGGQAANYIASWDGTAWAPLGSGTSWPVYAFAEYDGKLIVGGSFGSAGGIPVNKVAAWDGSSWSALGTGLDGNYRVNDMCVIRDTLWVTGVEDLYADNKLFIAAWDGSTWAMIESGTPGMGRAACMYMSGALLIGGYTLDGGSATPFVKTISGGVWYDWDHHSLPTTVFDLAYYDGYGHVGGTGSSPVRYFSMSWHPVGSDSFLGLGGGGASVYDLCVFGDNLIAVGDIESIGGTTVNNIAAWNGSAWSPLGTGFRNANWVNALAVWQNKLYVGGDFFEAGGVVADNIVEVSFE
jgi:hypothetical protein